MKKLYFGFLVILLLFSLSCDDSSERTYTLILEYAPTGDGIAGGAKWGDNRAGTFGVMKPGQSFTVSEDTTCIKVELHIDSVLGSPVGDYTVSIRTDSSDEPSDTVLASATKSASELVIDGWNEWIFSSPASLTAGTTYWILGTTTEDTPTVNNFFSLSTSMDSGYADGRMGHYESETWSLDMELMDILFRLYR